MDDWTPQYDASDGKKIEQEFATDQAFQKLVESIQNGIIYLTNTRDTTRLIALQQITNELYRRADECMSANKDMATFDQID